MKKNALWIGLVVVAFVTGSYLSRLQTLRAYPPAAVKQITVAQNLVGELTKDDQRKLINDLQANMKFISKEFDYEALHQGMVARHFQVTLERKGEEAAQDLSVQLIAKFHQEYERGLDLPESHLKLAKILYESTKKEAELKKSNEPHIATPNHLPE